MYNVQFPELGIHLKIDPVAFSIGSFNVYWYGIIIGFGFILALIFALTNLKKFGIKRDDFIDCVLVGLICGILGARLYYVIFRWDYYSQHLNEILAVHNGGLAIYGGVIGSVLGGCIIAKIKLKIDRIIFVDGENKHPINNEYLERYVYYKNNEDRIFYKQEKLNPMPYDVEIVAQRINELLQSYKNDNQKLIKKNTHLQ